MPLRRQSPEEHVSRDGPRTPATAAGTRDVTELDEDVLRLARNALAASSQKSADSAERSFGSFLEEYGLHVGTAGLSDEDLARYIAWLWRKPSIGSYDTIKNYVSMGVRRWHQRHGLPWADISDRHFVNSVMQGARRSMGDSESRQKLPITIDILSSIRQQLNIGKSKDACLMAAFLLSFYCLLRKGNVVSDTATSEARAAAKELKKPRPAAAANPPKRGKAAARAGGGQAAAAAAEEPPRPPPLVTAVIRRCDISIDAKGDMWVTLRRTKTIQFGERVLILPVPRIEGSPLCPRTLVLHHMRLSLTLGRPVTDPLFGYYDEKTKKWVALTYAVFVRELKELLKKVGVDQAKYAGHSFRRGGATFTYECTLNPLLVKALGDWISDTFMRYCEIQIGMRRQAAAALAEGTLTAEAARSKTAHAGPAASRGPV